MCPQLNKSLDSIRFLSMFYFSRQLLLVWNIRCLKDIPYQTAQAENRLTFHHLQRMFCILPISFFFSKGNSTMLVLFNSLYSKSICYYIYNFSLIYLTDIFFTGCQISDFFRIKGEFVTLHPISKDFNNWGRFEVLERG